MKKIEKKWRRILNIPFLKGDKVRLRNDALLDLVYNPYVAKLIATEEILEVVETREGAVIVKDGAGVKMKVEPELLEVVEYAEN